MADKIVDYTVVESHDLGSLVTEVRGLLAKGFEPLGGIQVVAPVVEHAQVEPLYVQSMTKRQ